MHLFEWIGFDDDVNDGGRQDGEATHTKRRVASHRPGLLRVVEETCSQHRQAAMSRNGWTMASVSQHHQEQKRWHRQSRDDGATASVLDGAGVDGVVGLKSREHTRSRHRLFYGDATARADDESAAVKRTYFRRRTKPSAARSSSQGLRVLSQDRHASSAPRLRLHLRKVELMVDRTDEMRRRKHDDLRIRRADGRMATSLRKLPDRHAAFQKRWKQRRPKHREFGGRGQSSFHRNHDTRLAAASDVRRTGGDHSTILDALTEQFVRAGTDAAVMHSTREREDYTLDSDDDEERDDRGDKNGKNGKSDKSDKNGKSDKNDKNDENDGYDGMTHLSVFRSTLRRCEFVRQGRDCGVVPSDHVTQELVGAYRSLYVPAATHQFHIFLDSLAPVISRAQRSALSDMWSDMSNTSCKCITLCSTPPVG